MKIIEGIDRRGSQISTTIVSIHYMRIDANYAPNLCNETYDYASSLLGRVYSQCVVQFPSKYQF